MRLSYSSIQRHGYTYDNKLIGCQWSYYLRYIKQIRPTQVDSKYGRFGGILHDIFACFYPTLDMKQIINYPSPKNYFDKILFELISKKWDYTLSEAQYKDAISILENFSQNESNKYLAFRVGETQFMPLHIELALDDPFNIRIDKVNRDNTLIDYKTAKELPETVGIEHILQAGTYAISYFKKFAVWPNSCVFYFVRFNKYLKVDINDIVIKTTQDIANQVTENINKGKFIKNSENCKWCDMRHVCGLEEIRLI